MKRLLGKARSGPPEAELPPDPAVEVKPASPWADWRDVEQRLDELAEQSPDAVIPFVQEVIDETRSPVVVACLARHPASANSLRSWLETADRTALRERAASGELLAAALAGAARLLLPTEAADSVADTVEENLTALSTQYFQFRDGVAGHRPAGARTAEAAAKHRLIIAEQFDDPRMVALLLPGCERATLISTADTYGRADFSDRAAWTGSGDLTVEHVRSRITRYSAEYIGLHEATARVAEQLAADVEQVPGLLRSDDRPFVAVDIADFLFFRALRFRAVEVLLDDPTIDHIVIAIAAQTPFSEFLRSLSGIERIRTDQRIEFVSIARDEQPRTDFWRALDAILTPPAVAASPPRRLPADTVARHFSALAHAREMAVEAANEPWVLLATADNSAYNASTAVCAVELAQDHPVRVLHMHGTAKNVTKAMAPLEGADSVPITTYEGGPVRDNPMPDLMRAHLQGRRAALVADASSPHDRAAAYGLHASFEVLVAVIIVPALLRAKVLERRFARWREESRLPTAVLLIPQRSPGVGAVAAVARRYGIPSVAAEPHVYVPEYSRYNKIAADYYGVLSEYFLEGAVHDFGMGSHDRVRVIGSPRLTAPPGYEPEAARELARAKYTKQHDFDFATAPVHLVFFCQPSGWEHVAKLWDLVLDGVERSGAHLFFKPHPEEAPARIRLYEERVERRGLTDRVTRLGGDAGDAVALADVVATAYSAAALDAAIRQKPVVCVAVGDTQYPVDTAAISGAHVCRSADELAAFLTEYAQNPSSAQTRARTWIEREHQFIEGSGPALRQLVADAIAAGEKGIRPSAEVPQSLFTDGPHPVLQV
jgi:hypothetical protein